MAGEKVHFKGISDDIDTATVLNLRPIIFHGYVLPFLILYAIVGYFWVFVYGLELYLEIGVITMAVVAGLQILTSLFCLWSVHVNCTLTCSVAQSVHMAEWVKVNPTVNNGYPELVRLQKKRLHTGGERISFVFQKMMYTYEESGQFKPVQFPTDKSLGDYLEWKGYTEEEDLTTAAQVYGRNTVVLDIPKFRELFIERATAPFFVFQVFCVGLWCLDDYWYYSLFTLFMLGAFEATLVQQQLSNMAEIRKMAAKPYPIQTYRSKRWRPVMSDELVPGDLVSIGRSQEERLVPCDLLLLKGPCIIDESMLTGESVPVMKEPIEHREMKDTLDVDVDGKLHVLYGGTKVVQHTAPTKGTAGIRPGDNGCLAYVLRNGFSTSQGKLLRTILYSVKRVTANNLETFLFILFLLVFAIAAASYVWIYGTVDERRNKYKLFLECTLILTSVVPPELPIELSLAVNTSLLALSKLYVFCTEPFRIPFAGKIDVCCFDKTGTLTSDKLVVEGVAGIEGKADILPVSECPLETAHVLASCHSLAQLDDDLVGDPLEKATLSAVEWSLTRNDAVVPSRKTGHGLKIVQRWHFSSALKRMSVLVGFTPTGSVDMNYNITCKGAPETLKSRFHSVPETYDSVYLELARRGARVLALGYRRLGVLTHQQVRDLSRDEVEQKLDFVGFVIISCPLKSDSKAVIKEIQQSSHHTVMITGDNPLTACHVARELRMCRKQTLLLQQPELNGAAEEWAWQSIDKKVKLPVTSTRREMGDKYDLCVTGEGLVYLDSNHSELLKSLLPFIKVYARVAPKQKEFVITSLRDRGYVTLMCGDGTNDVGALKHAHVGVALLANAPERISSKKVTETSVDPVSKKSKGSVRTSASSSRQTVGSSRAARLKQMTNSAKQSGLSSEQQQRLNNLLSELDDEAAVVKLGDASIAAPFTYKLSSPQCVCHIIKQGRCTLVTTLQMFKILALNALILAYSQSALYLQGVKMSDTQATLQGLLLAGCFLFITRSKPLKVLSAERPLANIFNVYTLLTVLCQFGLHFWTLYHLVSTALTLEPRGEGEYIDLDADFKPSLLNSTVYVISMSLQVSTFAVNYKGLPFMQRLQDNKPLLYSLLFSAFAVFCLTSGLVPEAAEQFELVEFPPDFSFQLTQTLLIDFIGAFIIDRILQFLFCRTKLKSP